VETGFGDGNTAEKDSRQIYKNELLSLFISFSNLRVLRVLRVQDIKIPIHIKIPTKWLPLLESLSLGMDWDL
jgi:hypothetical protein